MCDRTVSVTQYLCAHSVTCQPGVHCLLCQFHPALTCPLCVVNVTQYLRCGHPLCVVSVSVSHCTHAPTVCCVSFTLRTSHCVLCQCHTVSTHPLCIVSVSHRTRTPTVCCVSVTLYPHRTVCCVSVTLYPHTHCVLCQCHIVPMRSLHDLSVSHNTHGLTA